jgi:hydroxyacylglutathione hydrolase
MQVRRLTVGPFQSNCYLVGPTSSGRAIVVDPGDEPARIVDAVGRAGGDLAAILLTHGHLDHVGAVAALVREFGAPVYMHPEDLPLYERASELGLQFGVRIEAPPTPDEAFADGQEVRPAG